jgi:hypothetical protein
MKVFENYAKSSLLNGKDVEYKFKNSVFAQMFATVIIIVAII